MSAAHPLDGCPMDPASVPTEPLPTLPGFPYLHRGAAAVIVGPTGGGRSSLVQAGAYDAARANLRVAYLGSEITPAEFNARAADLAARRGDTVDEALRGELARVRYLDLASVVARAWEVPQAWVDEAIKRFDIIIIDPLSAVASTLGLDFDKSNAEFVRFYDRLVQPVAAAGAAVVMLDNVGHAHEAKTRAKGASAKSDRADLTFSCTLQATPQALIITAHKVRTVRAPFHRGAEWTFDRATQRITERDTPAEPPPAFRPTVLMERVSRALEAEPGLSKNAVRAAVKGRGKHVDLALDLLVAEGNAERRRDGQTHHHHIVRAYRQADDPTVSTASAPCPEHVPDTAEETVSTVSPPLRSRRDTGHGHTTTQDTPNRVPNQDDDLQARAEQLEHDYAGDLT